MLDMRERAIDELRERLNIPGPGVADFGGGTTTAGDGVGWGVFDRRIAGAELGEDAMESFEPGMEILREAWRIFARRLDAFGIGGGIGGQVCSPRPVRGTGWEQVEHFTVGRSWEMRSPALIGGWSAIVD